MFKPTLNEVTHPSSVDFRLQNYYIFLIYANKYEIFMKNVAYHATKQTMFLEIPPEVNSQY